MPALQPSITNMFHAKDGLFFSRRPNGSVYIIKMADSKTPDGFDFVADVILSESEWASVVSSVSAGGETSARWRQARLFHGTDFPHSQKGQEPEWIGVDLDRTLAHYDGWDDGYIGEPLEPMVSRLKAWLAEGKVVKIFTARADHGPSEVMKVQDWCQKHLGRRLEVTNIKTPDCAEIWDDKARRVEENTGEAI